jgi:hypothetical protein
MTKIPGQETIRDVEFSKLPPKAFYPKSRRDHITKHVLVATAAFLSIGVFIGIELNAYYGPGSSNTVFQPGDTYGTYCSVAGLTAVFGGGSKWLTISTAYGTLTFAQAKVCDLAWDVVVSRGGQALLAWICYRVYTAILMSIMEERHISYELYVAIALQYTSFVSLRPISRAFFTKLGWRKNLLLVWLAVSIIWVAFWPTITNAFTGYISRNDTWVK